MITNGKERGSRFPSHSRCGSRMSQHFGSEDFAIFYLQVKYLLSFRVIMTNTIHGNMSEVELILLNNNNDKCTVYTIKFLGDEMSEFNKFVAKFREDSRLNADYRAIIRYVEQIIERGALERYFRNEGKMRDSVVALPALKSRLRLYALRLSDKIIILGNGGVKTTRTYEEDNLLQGYVVTLQKFEELLRSGVKNGSVVITENTIDADETFEL